jgi:predicted transporter
MATVITPAIEDGQFKITKRLSYFDQVFNQSFITLSAHIVFGVYKVIRGINIQKSWSRTDTDLLPKASLCVRLNLLLSN